MTRSKKKIEIFATPESKENPVNLVSISGHENKAYVNDNSYDNISDSSGVSSIEESKKDNGTPPVVEIERKDKHSDFQMKKSLNLVHCVAIMIAVTGHSSIFISPAAILKSAGSVGASLIVWLVGGLINMMLALCFAELGTMLPKAGGPYAYVMRTFGPLPGFLILWGYVVLISGPFWAFLAYTAALYIFQPFFPDCEAPENAVKLLAGWIMITFVVINCVYMKYVTKVQTLLSSTKVLALLIIIASGIVNFTKGETESFEHIFEGTTKEPGEFAVAIFYSIFSYGGWQVMTSLMEEVKKPEKDLPRSVFIAMIAVIMKYVLTNVAYFTLMSPSEVVASNAVALVYIQRFYKPLTAVISVFVALTSIGALNASIMGHSRLIFAGARVGHMPTILGMIHRKYLTPWPAIIVLLAWGLAMLYTGGVTDMMEFISLFSTIMGIAVVSSLLYLRITKPKLPRPYQTMLFVPVSMFIVNIAVLVLAIYQKPHKMGIGLAILFSGIPIYWFGVLWNPKPLPFKELTEALTVFMQKILMIEKTS
ncbi:Y+L amino acid transporter 2-like [Mytilus californianus]|uniref:Y+L amino acid transporter 2-like n=1 Tax=Mytilus californianus TaxID=6549 RepID=UPI00224547E9|nr:Y+L amino acid transporter 2-like [Mytilus californianus]